MNTECSSKKDLTAQELESLFLSVEWSSGHFPDKLVVAMENFSTVVSTWDGKNLIDKIYAMDDGVKLVYEKMEKRLH